MAIELTMPKLGLTMDEGTINSWLIKEGEYIEAGKTLLTIETDKVTIDVESPASGTLLKIFVKEGETVPVSHLIGYLGRPGEALPERLVQEKPTSNFVPAKIKPEKIDNLRSSFQTGLPILISPIARKLAEANNLDYSTIKGTGPGGRIVEEDIQKVLKAENANEANKLYRLEKISPLKRVTAQKMTESFRDVPHFYLQKQIMVDKMVELRERLNSNTQQNTLIHLTYTDFFLKSIAVSLQSHTWLNACWAEDGIHLFNEVNLGFAVATPKGLVVAVIKDAQSKSLTTIAKERGELSKKAKENSLTQDDISGGTFTLTNLGMYEIDSFMPIINPPQTAILAIGGISEKPVVEDHKVEVRQVLNITLAADHRTVDGVQAAEFVNSFTQLITDNPDKLI